MYHNDDNRGDSSDMRAGCHWRLDRQWARAGKLPVALHPGQSVRRADRGPLFPKTAQRLARLMTCGVVLQASSCTFDSEAFFGDSLAAIFDNIATTLIITTLADLLGVAPTFGF